jgi:hypothetical protein
VSTLQDQILRWIALQPASVGLLIFGIGLLFGFEGWRFYRFLLGAILGGLGYIAGALAGSMGQMPEVGAGIGGLGIGVLIAWRGPRISETLGATGIFAIFGWYLAQQFGFPGSWPLACAAILAGIGAMLANVSRRTMPMLITTMIGGFLMMVGVVGLTATYIPSFSSTFRDFAHAWPLVGPIMVAMAIAMSYAYQSNHKQGSITSGA